MRQGGATGRVASEICWPSDCTKNTAYWDSGAKIQGENCIFLIVEGVRAKYIYIYIYHSIDAEMTIKKKSGDKKAGKNIASCFLKKKNK